MKTYNELIAEFMGMQKTNAGWYDAEENLPLGYTTDNTFDELLFNKSWDWLMPVVEKIEDIQDGDIGDAIRSHLYNVEITQIFCEITECHTSKQIAFVDEEKKITSAYLAVVEFIKWYNKKNKKGGKQIMTPHEEIDNAIETLRKHGYSVGNLWGTNDVRSEFECTEDEAMEVLEKSLDNDFLNDTIRIFILDNGTELGLKRKEETL
jgi:hypothetical protein